MTKSINLIIFHIRCVLNALVIHQGGMMNCLHSDFQENINNPTIILPWNEPAPPPAALKCIELIEYFGGTIKKLNFVDPGVDSLKLKAEVDDLMNLYNKKMLPHLKAKSIAHCILNNANKADYPEIAKIIKKVKSAMKNVHALFLPGGYDVPPFFYGQEHEPTTNQIDDLRRDIFEFAMLNSADHKKIPILGICRGLQITNVWYGGSLTQHVEGHSYVIQKLKPVENIQDFFPESIIAKIFSQANDCITGYSIHHQAVEFPGHNLQVISRYQDGTIKALEGDKKRFITLLQWHPERIVLDSTEEERNLASQMSKENYLFFKYFVEAAKQS